MAALDAWSFTNTPYKVEGKSVITLFIREFLPNHDPQPLLLREQDPELFFNALMDQQLLSFMQPYISSGTARGRCICTEPAPMVYGEPSRLPYIIVPFLNGNLRESISAYFESQETRQCSGCQGLYQVRNINRLMEPAEIIPVKIERLILDPRTTDDQHFPPIHRRDPLQLDDSYMVPDPNGNPSFFTLISAIEHSGSENSGTLEFLISVAP